MVGGGAVGVVHRRKPPQMRMWGVPAVVDSFGRMKAAEVGDGRGRKRWRERVLGLRALGIPTVPGGRVTSRIVDIDTSGHPEPRHL